MSGIYLEVFSVPRPSSDLRPRSMQQRRKEREEGSKATYFFLFLPSFRASKVPFPPQSSLSPSLGILASVTTRKRNGQETEEGRKADLIKPLRSASFGYQKVILRGGHPNLGFRLFLYEVTSEALSLLCPTKLL